MPRFHPLPACSRSVHPWNFQLGLPMITSAFAANPSFLQSGICLETNNNAHVRDLGGK